MTSTKNYLGFTSDCLKRIEASRRNIDEFVEANKKRADAAVSDLKRIQSIEQQKIDSLLRQLKSLQYERGVIEKSKEGGGNKTDDANSKTGGGGIVERRNKLESKLKRLEEEASMLDARNRIEKEQLEGMMFSPHLRIIFYFSLLNYVSIKTNFMVVCGEIIIVD